jgi:hypothetical protein
VAGSSAISGKGNMTSVPQNKVEGLMSGSKKNALDVAGSLAISGKGNMTSVPQNKVEGSMSGSKKDFCP